MGWDVGMVWLIPKKNLTERRFADTLRSQKDLPETAIRYNLVMAEVMRGRGRLEEAEACLGNAKEALDKGEYHIPDKEGLSLKVQRAEEALRLERGER